MHEFTPTGNNLSGKFFFINSRPSAAVRAIEIGKLVFVRSFYIITTINMPIHLACLYLPAG
ncbi:hypothetical protein D0466_15455 [Peribacillus glennii]|uniref:Uncharacterized protein n=1 Tax=Peribacillus glennii TaxID=2303991 RepID=A0A372L9T6_9BACI|nr:hypothetical protein D0466_15455 [Peribacillus glennii]